MRSVSFTLSTNSRNEPHSWHIQVVFKENLYSTVCMKLLHGYKSIGIRGFRAVSAMNVPTQTWIHPTGRALAGCERLKNLIMEADSSQEMQREFNLIH